MNHEMTKERLALTTQGLSPWTFLLYLLAACMMGLGLYLFLHYVEMHFPESLAQSSGLCDLSSFFNCDSATFSPMANIIGIPVALFGGLVGLFLLLGLIFPSEEQERQLKTLLLLNAVGCLFFFGYSLAILGSLCPFCTLYYIASWMAWFTLHIKSPLSYGIHWKSALLQIALITASGFGARQYLGEKEQYRTVISEKILQEYSKLENLGAPEYLSPYTIGNKGNQAPVSILVFSDFQCPFCQKFAELLHKLQRRYPTELSIHYYFFPLDAKCNSEVKSSLHGSACNAAYLAACDQKQFQSIHDELFAHQEQIDETWLLQFAESKRLTQCLTDPVVQKEITQHIEQGIRYRVQSTPTLFINGKKIAGMIPMIHIMAIIDDLLKKAPQAAQ